MNQTLLGTLSLKRVRGTIMYDDLAMVYFSHMEDIMETFFLILTIFGTVGIIIFLGIKFSNTPVNYDL